MHAGADYCFTYVYCGIFAEGKNCKAGRQPLLGNRFTRNNGVIGKLRSLRDPCDSYVMQQQNCWEVFSIGSVPRLYNEEQL
jgi:hypothetical protein